MKNNKRQSVPKKYNYRELAKGISAARKELKGIPTGYFGAPTYYAMPAKPGEVKATRAKLKLTQEKFGRVMGVTEDTVKSWEQGKRNPEGPATKLIRLVFQMPGLAKKLAPAP